MPEQKLEEAIKQLGITELSPETLKAARLGQDLLDEVKSVIDEGQKPIH